MRQEHPAILDGDLEFLLEEHPDVLMYTRRCARQTLLVIANKSDNPTPVQIPAQLQDRQWERVLTNYESIAPSMDGRDFWQPWEAEVYQAVL